MRGHSLLAVLLLLAAQLGVRAQWSAGATGRCQAVLDWADAEGHNALRSVAEAAGLDTYLADAGLDVTIFVPTGAAFDAFVDDLGLTPGQFLALRKERLVELLSYHIVPAGALRSGALRDGQRLPTLLSGVAAAGGAGEAALAASQLVVGKKMRLVSDASWGRAAELSIQPSGGDSPAKVVKADVQACKAVVHVIDAVLVPSSKVTPAPPPASPPPPAPRPPPPSPRPPPPPSPSPPPPPPPPPSPLPSPSPSPPPPRSALTSPPPMPSPALRPPPPATRDQAATSPAQRAPPATRPPPPSPLLVPSPPPRSCFTVLEMAASDTQFNALIAVARASGFDQALLNDPKVQGTFFAPTDAAFDALVRQMRLASPQELLTQTALVGQILSYHFVPGEAAYSVLMQDSQKLTTLLTAATAGRQLNSRAREATRLTVDKMFRTGRTGAQVSILPSGSSPARVVKADIAACGVLVHVVDSVLVPDLSLIDGRERQTMRIA